MTSACLCNSPALPVVSERRKRSPSHPEAVTAKELLGGREEGGGTKAILLAPPSLPAHHVSVRGEARTRAQRSEMVRCCWRPPNPAVPRHDLRKVRVHVQRSRNGGGGRGPGDQPPRLEGPGPGGLSRRARFRYPGRRSGLVAQCLCCTQTAAPPPGLGAALPGLVPVLLQ